MDDVSARYKTKRGQANCMIHSRICVGFFHLFYTNTIKAETPRNEKYESCEHQCL
jgi:hypothetical protein